MPSSSPVVAPAKQNSRSPTPHRRTHMGAAASRAGRRAAADTAVRAPAGGPLPAGGAVAADAERAAAAAAAQQARRGALTLEEEEALEARDPALGSLLDRLGGAIRGRHVDVTGGGGGGGDKPAVPPASPASSGRLPPQALKELLQLQRAAAGGPVDARHLVDRYKADPELVQQVLSRVCLPELVRAEGSAGVEAFAEWPSWFQRHR